MGLFEDQDHIHIVQELCTGGDLLRCAGSLLHVRSIGVPHIPELAAKEILQCGTPRSWSCKLLLFMLCVVCGSVWQCCVCAGGGDARTPFCWRGGSSMVLLSCNGAC